MRPGLIVLAVAVLIGAGVLVVVLQDGDGEAKPTTSATGDTTGTTTQGDGAGAAARAVKLKRIGSFESPLYVTSPPNDRRRVFVVEQGGRTIGPVTGVEGTMEMSRLVIAGSHGEVLIPLVAEICTEIDVRGRRIVVSPPDGLLELNAPGGRP